MNYSTDGRLDEIRRARGYSFEDQVRGKFILIYSYSIALCTSSSLTDHLLARVPPRLRYQAEEFFPGASAHRRRDSVRARGPRIFRRSRVSFVKGSLTVIRTASPNAFPSEPKIMCRVSRGNCPWAFPAGQPWISRNHAVWLRSTTFPSHFTNGPAHMPRPPLPSFLAPIPTPYDIRLAPFLPAASFAVPNFHFSLSRLLFPLAATRLDVKSPNTLHASQTFACSDARFECQSLIGTC